MRAQGPNVGQARFMDAQTVLEARRQLVLLGHKEERNRGLSLADEARRARWRDVLREAVDGSRTANAVASRREST